MATGAATAPSPLSLTVRLVVGQPAPPPPAGDQDGAGDDIYAILPGRAPHYQAPSGAGVLHPAALSAVAGSARRLLALAGASPGADVGVLTRAMQELERLAAGGTAADRAELTTSASTAADMDIDSAATSSSQPGGGGAGAARGSNPGAKRKLDAPGMLQRPAKRRILAWRGRQYRSSVAKAQATARRRRARAQPTRRRRREAGSWKSVQQQLARATLGDGLHRWMPGGGGGGGPAQQ